MFEFHQTLSYEMINNSKFILKPNIGLNYRFYKFNASINLPYNVIPQRAFSVFYGRGDRVRLNSFDGEGVKNFKSEFSNLGYSFQLQTQFKLSNKYWLSITPFLEPDYDAIQNTGGCYVGIIFKEF
jgi:hypothetical protein